MLKYLNIADRPKRLTQQIDRSFDIISSSSRKWPLNGSPVYELALVPETYLLMQLILDNPNKTNFNVLDVGAGNFTSLTTLSNFIKIKINNYTLPSNIHINLIGIRGEPNEDNTSLVQLLPNCTIYPLGNFKIEELTNEFIQKGFNDFIGNIDFMFSSFTLIHLVDPIGTICQMHNCLNNNGIMIFDNNFRYQILTNHQLTHYDEQEVANIFLPYFIKANDQTLIMFQKNSYPITIIKKHTQSTLQFNFSYYEGEEYHVHKLLQSHTVLDIIKLDSNYNNINYQSSFVGDKFLFNFLLKAIQQQINDYLSLLVINENPLTAISDEYAYLISYSKNEDYAYNHKIISVLNLQDQYKVNTVGELSKKIINQLDSINLCINNNSLAFQYIDKEYKTLRQYNFCETDFNTLYHLNEQEVALINNLNDSHENCS